MADGFRCELSPEGPLGWGTLSSLMKVLGTVGAAARWRLDSPVESSECWFPPSGRNSVEDLFVVGFAVELLIGEDMAMEEICLLADLTAASNACLKWSGRPS